MNQQAVIAFRRKRRVAGIVGVLIVCSLVALTIAIYQKAFVPVVTVSMTSDRTGLLLDKGADVRAFGVPIGEVRATHVNADGSVTVDLAIDKDQAPMVPAAIEADIRATTTFGAKYVELDIPAGGSTGAPVIASGDVIQARSVPTEANTVFDHLQSVMRSVRPSDLNTTLTAMSTALAGRGDELGDYFVQLDGYLRTLNANSDDLSTDLTSAAKVSDTYADVAPAFLKIAQNATTTSQTLATGSAALDALLADFTKATRRGTEFVNTLRDPLVRALHVYRPGLEALEEYSVAFPCIINGLASYSDYIALALGGNVPGIQGNTDFGPGQRGYRYPQDLPKLDTTTGPHCYTAPSTRPNDPPRRVFDDGTTSYTDPGDAPSIPKDPIKFYETVLGLPFPKGLG